MDHKPLLKILSDRALEAIPDARLRNLKEKTLRYRFKVVYIPGSKNEAADSASRYPSGPTKTKTSTLSDDSAVLTHRLTLQVRCAPCWSALVVRSRAAESESESESESVGVGSFGRSRSWSRSR